MTTQADDNGGFDTPKEHPFELDGITLIAQRQDPYGYFYFKSESLVPEELSGAYTSLFEVERAANTFNNKIKNQKLKEAAEKAASTMPLGAPRKLTGEFN